MEAPEILGIIKGRQDALENSSMNTDTSEALAKRADLTRMPADDCGDLLREIEAVNGPDFVTERRSASRP